MSGAKFISLTNAKNNRVVDPHFRYKRLRIAVNKAITLATTEKIPVHILDLSRGYRLATVRHDRTNAFNINVYYPSTFHQLWNS